MPDRAGVHKRGHVYRKSDCKILTKEKAVMGSPLVQKRIGMWETCLVLTQVWNKSERYGREARYGEHVYG